MSSSKKRIDIQDYNVFNIKPYLIIILILFLFSIIFTTLLKPEIIRKAPPPPTVTGVTVEGPSYNNFIPYKDFTVFGYGDYSGTLAELNSKYQWYVNNNPYGSQGNLSKLFLAHFDGTFISEEGYNPSQQIGLAYVTGRFGQGIDLKGTGDVLSYQTPTGFNIDKTTIEMWVKPHWNSGQYVITDDAQHNIYYQKGSGNNWIRLYHQNGGKLFINFMRNGNPLNQNVIKIVTWKPEEWHHISIVIDSSGGVGRVRFYVDGQSSFIGAYSTPLSLNQLFYLGSSDGGTNVFNGVFDEVRIHNRALSSDEVYESFTLGRAYHSNEQMLDLSTLSIGDKIKLEYTPCNINNECGTSGISPEITIQQFNPTITVDANNELRPFNRDLMGLNTGYDNYSIGVGPYGGSGFHIWDQSRDAPNLVTLNYAQQLAPAGLVRVWPTESMYDDIPEGRWPWPPTVQQMSELIDNMMEFASQAGISAADPTIAPYLINLGHNHNAPPYSGDLIPLGNQNYNNGCPDNNLYPTYEQGWSEVLNYTNIQKGYNIKYWEVLNEPYGRKTAEEIACEANTYARALKAVDPNIRMIVPVRNEEIDELLDNIDPDLVDDIQFHFYQGRYMYDDQAGPIISGCYNTNQQLDPNFVLQEIYPHTVGGSLEYAKELSQFFRNKLDLKFPAYNKKIHLDEWSVSMHFWDRTYPNLPDYCYSMYQSVPTLMSSVARSALRNVMIKEGLVDSLSQFTFHYSNSDWSFIQLSGTGVLTNYLDHKIYEDYIGDIVLNDDTKTTVFDSSGDDVHTYDVENNPSLSVLSTKSSDGSKLYLLVVNREANRDITTQINLQNFIPQSATKAELDVRVQSNLEVLESICTGPLHFPSGSCDNNRITIVTSSIPASSQFPYTFPAHSVTGFEFSGSGQTNCDIDNDGYLSNSVECNGNDCNDNNNAVYPNAPELCDGIDNDCNNIIPSNEDDNDNDNYMICENDCKDTDPEIRPGATELCDSIDNNCNNEIDENCNIQGFTAYQTSTPITIDGLMNEWNSLDGFIPSTADKTTYGDVVNDNTDLSANFSALWDSNYLYIGVRVFDNALISDSSPNYCNNLGLDDSVELYLDGLNDNCDNGCFDNPLQCPGSISSHPDDHQYTVDLENNLGGINSQANGPITHAVSQLTDGYFIEYAVPWSNLETTPLSGLTIGFDLGINDDDGNNYGNRESQIMWSGHGQGYYNTSVYGNLILAESYTPYCGNDVIDEGEDCEGANLNGNTCTSFGYTGGTLTCSNCQFNTTNCYSSPAPPQDTSGGGGGGGGGSSREEGESESESETLEEQLININLFENQELTITSQLQTLIITTNNINEHIMLITSITNTQIIFTLDGEETTLSIGESNTFTLDGINIQITLNSITSGNAYLTFKRTQEIPLSKQIIGKTLPQLKIIIPIIIIVLIITFIILKKEKSYLKARARIYTLRKQGYTNDQIKELFKKKGWQEQEVNKLFKK